MTSFKIINITTPTIVESGNCDLYQYRVYVGEHQIETSRHASYWYLKNSLAVSHTGDDTVLVSNQMCVEIMGYTPEYRASSFDRGTDLPYVNGCSTKQLINPARPGDPTFQMLYIPPNTSEQVHHIHATPRVVYVAEGEGVSVVGSAESSKKYKLNKGGVIILPKMVPHHFMTKKSSLTVLPVHVFSSIASAEFDHPMFNGTHKV
jgi:quercetin dioxygenase-like cupin family protein